MKITVAGAGYVGVSNAILLAQNNEVCLLDPQIEKVSLLNNRISPIVDELINEYLQTKNLDLKATTDEIYAYSNTDYVIIAAPTNYIDEENGFDTSIINNILHKVRNYSPNSTIIIKSTVPIGFTESVFYEDIGMNIFFCPEFLREGYAFYDCLNPSRIIVGIPNYSKERLNKANLVAELFSEATDNNPPKMFMGSSEAEAVKLFSNTYLALRISFFNELDTYAEMFNLESKDIIEGMGFDCRIGQYYNNPSFGYGGYCLPKDTRQLLSHYKTVPQNIIQAIVKSNETRKDYIISNILKRKPNTVGIYRLQMKHNSDNFRASSSIDIINRLKAYKIDVFIYEPLVKGDYFEGVTVINDISEFAQKCDVIVANRLSSELELYREKVYSRDLFCSN